MTILTSQDKSLIKRTVPKTSSTIIDATVARLYVSQDFENWTWTGMMGALILIDDLIGHTFWFKLLDLTTGEVLWDHELWTDFVYSQDRLFFHSFESNDYQVGFLFEDKSDAQHFFKRVNHRAKYASKGTINNNNAIEIRKKPNDEPVVGFRGQSAGPNGNNEQRSRRSKGILYYDDQPPPEWRSFYSQLEQMGITEDMIAENREFIKDYISKQGGPLVGLEPPIPRRFQHQQTTSMAAVTSKPKSRSNTVSSGSSRQKKAPPPPPPSQNFDSDSRSNTADLDSDTTNSIYRSEEGTLAPSSPSPPTAAPMKHRVPPPPTFNVPPFQPQQQQNALPPLPPLQQQNQPSPPPPLNLPSRNAPPTLPGRTPPPILPSRTGPPPPPARNPNAPPAPPPRHAASGNANVPPPPPPRRGNAPPPPPSRTAMGHINIPPPPNRQPNVPGVSVLPPANVSVPPRAPPLANNIPPPPPLANNIPPPPPLANNIPPPPPLANNIPPPPPLANNIPPPPPLANNIPPPPPLANNIPPPPPLANNIPPPPPMFNNAEQSAPPLPQVDGGRDALLASIRSSGLGSLKKVDKSQLDKPSVLLQEAKGEPVSTPSQAPSGGPPNNLADALAAALSSRKKKVAVSDDESDGGW